MDYGVIQYGSLNVIQDVDLEKIINYNKIILCGDSILTDPENFRESDNTSFQDQLADAFINSQVTLTTEIRNHSLYV